MPTFKPCLSILPPAQRNLWPELGATPPHFTLYEGTALALRLGHRSSVDFDFFSNQAFDPDTLRGLIPYLTGAEVVQVAPDTLTCRVERGGPILVSYFGSLRLGKVGVAEKPENVEINIASLMDIAATKVAVVQKRAELKDFVDIDALMTAGVGLDWALSAARAVYGPQFNPLISIKALSFFDDVPRLSSGAKQRLLSAISRVSIANLPRISLVGESEPAT